MRDTWKNEDFDKQFMKCDCVVFGCLIKFEYEQFVRKIE
jgi:hypothetical protein